MPGCALRNRIKQLAARLQNAEEVGETLLAADVIPTVFELAPDYEVSQFERTPFRSDLSREANISGTIKSMVNFQIEPKGSGTAGTRPNYARFLMASGYAEVKLTRLTVSAPAGGPLEMGDMLSDSTGDDFIVFTKQRIPTEIICYRVRGVGLPVTPITGPLAYTAVFGSHDDNYGWGFEPYSKTTQIIPFAGLVGTYQPGEYILGGTSGAEGRVIYVGSSNIWYQPIGVIAFVTAETLTGQVSAATSTSSAVPSCSQPTPPITAWVNQDGVRTVANGCRGRVNFVFGAVGEPGRFEFELMGPSGVNPADAASFPELADALIPPKFQGATLQLGDPALPYVPVLSKLNVQTDNTLSMRMDATAASGLRSALITSRQFTGAFDPEMTAVADFAFHAAWFNDVLNRFYGRIGSVAGNIVEFYGEKLQLTTVKFDNRDDILLAGSDFRFSRVVGDDEYKIVVR